MRKTGRIAAPRFPSVEPCSDKVTCDLVPWSSTLLVIQHVPHERLGTFEAVFKAARYMLRTLNVYKSNVVWPSMDEIDGLVVMGGPQSVYEQTKYPYLTKEIALLKGAVRAEKPVLGVCLGAQLLAAALGAKVTKNPQKEIGWYPLMRESARPGDRERRAGGADLSTRPRGLARDSAPRNSSALLHGDPLLEPFGQTETVFQWHSDTFSLPKGAVQLASSPLCRQQAFRFGTSAYGLQFHAEVTEAMIRSWIQANTAELAALRGVIDPATIRQQSPDHLPRLTELAQHVAGAFASQVRGVR